MTDMARRSLLAGASGFMIVSPELVRGSGPEKLKFGLVGCGGRGTEAAINLMTADPASELVGMGDIFPDKLQASFSVLSNLTNPDKEFSRDMNAEVRGTSETAETVQKPVKVRVAYLPRFLAESIIRFVPSMEMGQFPLWAARG